MQLLQGVERRTEQPIVASSILAPRIAIPMPIENAKELNSSGHPATAARPFHTSRDRGKTKGVKVGARTKGPRAGSADTRSSLPLWVMIHAGSGQRGQGDNMGEEIFGEGNNQPGENVLAREC